MADIERWSPKTDGHKKKWMAIVWKIIIRWNERTKIERFRKIMTVHFGSWSFTSLFEKWKTAHIVGPTINCHFCVMLAIFISTILKFLYWHLLSQKFWLFRRKRFILRKLKIYQKLRYQQVPESSWLRTSMFLITMFLNMIFLLD